MESSGTVPEQNPEIDLEFIGVLCTLLVLLMRILDVKDILNERTDTELRCLKKEPESWRLACQTIVENKENSGKVVVQRIPQWKK